MEELESQVAKIQIGNFKTTTSYVHIVTEKAVASDAELYLVVELPLFNPAAESSCEKIALAIAGTLRRAYRRNVGQASFESAIAQVNDELGKLASMGQTHWIDKLNCIIGVKDGTTFTVATCGKIAAYIYRNGEFTDISTPTQPSHPLKTFENYASGRLRLGDILILSTTQLYNHISVDRFKNILSGSGSNFLIATQTIIELLKENAGPEVAFGTILNMQVMPGQTPDGEIDLENYVAEQPRRFNLLYKAWGSIKSVLVFDKDARKPQVSLPKISLPKFKNLGGSSKRWAGKTRHAMSSAWSSLKSGSDNLGAAKIASYSREKKIFLAALVLMLIMIGVTITLASRHKNSQQTQATASSTLKEIQTLLSKASDSYLYKDEQNTRTFLSQAKEKLPTKDSIPSSQQALYTQITAQITDLQQKIDRTSEAKVQNLGTLGNADSLLKLPQFLAVQIGKTVVSYNLASGQVQDGALLSSETITRAVPLGAQTAVVYNGQALMVWDYQKHQFSAPFTLSVPQQNDSVGLALYPVNNRVYMVNKATRQVVSYLAGSSLSKPVVSVANAQDASNAIDLAVDGSIYVLSSSGVAKYQSGKPADFQLPFMYTPFSGKGRIATAKDYKNIYILDAGNNRIIIVDKKGTLVQTLVSKDFTKLKDFTVDEANKTMYILNDSSLLKVSY